MAAQTIQTKTENAPKGGAASAKNEHAAFTVPSVGLLVAHFLCAVISVIIVRSFWEFENAPAALAFYGVYHRYGWNQVIHFFGVPGLLWTLFIFMVHIPVPVVSNGMPFVRQITNGKDNKATSASSPPPLNYALFMSISYGLFYLQIDPIGGTLFAPVLYGMYKSAVNMRKQDQEAATGPAATVGIAATSSTPPWYGTGRTLKWAAVVHCLCWYLQIHWGHKVIEGAQPAVLQSLGGALTVAPLFAFYEGLWLMGINQELQESTKVLVDQYTNELCTSGQVLMKACKNLSS